MNVPLRSVFVSFLTLFLFVSAIVGFFIITSFTGFAIDSLVVMIDCLAFVYSFQWGRKKLGLQADRLAVQVVGKQEFLAVLRKIESFGLNDVVRTERQGFRRHFSRRPSVSERIANLSSLQ